MKDDSNTNAPGDAGDAQEVDINDADVSAQSERGTRPPPLPQFAQVAEPPRPSQPPMYSQPPHTGSMAPPPAKRRPMFYGVLLVGFVVLGLGAGAVLAVSLRKPPAPAQAPSAVRTFTIPTVDMNDEPDGGP